MKKVLLVSLSDSYGGIERLFYNIFCLNNTDCLVDIITFSDKCAYQESFEEKGYKIYSLPSRRKNMFKFNQIIKTFFKANNDYDYIWVNTSSTSMYQFQYYGKKLTSAKIITHSHGSDSEKSGVINNIINYCLAKINFNKVIKNTDIFLACSMKAGVSLFGKKLENKILLFNNVINIEKFKFDEKSRVAIREKFNIDYNKKVIGLVGRISSQKNIPFALKVFREYLDCDVNAICLVVGSGELAQFAQEKTREYNLSDKVIFTGNVSNVSDYLSAIDVLIMPSFFEGLPLTAIEAQANGLNCVLSDTITAEVALTNLVSFLSIDENVNSWVNKLLSIQVDNSKRINYYALMKNSGYDLSNVEENLKKVLQ